MDQDQKTRKYHGTQQVAKVNDTKTPPKKVFYDCECGKRYDAFPGLYLHFKRHHDIKISCHP